MTKRKRKQSEIFIDDNDNDILQSDSEISFDNREIKLSNLSKSDALDYIKENYTNHNSRIAFSSLHGLKKIFPNLELDDIRKTLSKFESWSLMLSSRDPKVYNPILAHNIRDLW